MPTIGTLVHTRKNITHAEIRPAGSPVTFSSDHKTFAGRIGIVVKADPDSTTKLFFNGTDASNILWWHNSWVTVLTEADENEQDVQFINDLRKSFQLKFPEAVAIHEPVQIQATKRIKFAVADIRDKLDAIDAEVAKITK